MKRVREVLGFVSLNIFMFMTFIPMTLLFFLIGFFEMIREKT